MCSSAATPSTRSTARSSRSGPPTTCWPTRRAPTPCTARRSSSWRPTGDLAAELAADAEPE
ncbi:hypothetical protein CTI14_05915, partial [Methylobacterium radiotolerans]